MVRPQWVWPSWCSELHRGRPHNNCSRSVRSQIIAAENEPVDNPNTPKHVPSPPHPLHYSGHRNPWRTSRGSTGPGRHFCLGFVSLICFLENTFYQTCCSCNSSKLSKYEFSFHLRTDDNTLPTSPAPPSISLVACFVLLIHIYWKAFFSALIPLFLGGAGGSGWGFCWPGWFLRWSASGAQCVLRPLEVENSILRAKGLQRNLRERNKAKVTSSALWFLSSKQSLKPQQLCPLLTSMTLFAHCVPMLSILYAGVLGICCWRIL